MLEEKDLQAIAGLIAGSEERLTKKIEAVDRKVDALEEKVDALDKKVNALDEKVNALDEKVNALDEKVDALDEKVNALDERVTALDKKVENRTKMLLDEIARTETYLEEKILRVQENQEELQQYYRITKLENDNSTLLLKMIEALQKDVEELKKKTA